MKHLAAALLLSVLLACGSAPEPETAQTPEPAAAPAPPPRDESYRFPKDGLVSTSIATDHILGKDFMPPGNVAEYNLDGKTYTMFLIATTNEERATMTAFDIKGRLTDSTFIADFGGYAGTLDGEPWFIFPKQRAVAGIVGLPQDEAYELGRVLGSQMQ